MQSQNVRPRSNAASSVTDTDLVPELYAALVQAKCLATPAAQADFVSLLAQQPMLIRKAELALLRYLRQQGVGNNLIRCAEAEALACVLGAAHIRLADLLTWQPSKGSFAHWWGLQAFYHYNNTQRRHDERSCGFWRSTGDYLRLECDWQQNEAGEWEALPLADSDADPANRYAAGQQYHWDDLVPHLLGEETQHIQRLQSWMAAGALWDEPVTWEGNVARLNWQHGAQVALAQAQGVTTRTLRNHAKAIEQTLARVAGRIAAKAGDEMLW